MNDDRRDPSSVETALPRVVPTPLSWVERARRGDRAALEQLARREAPRVARLLNRILGPRADLEDLVQIVFVELLRALPSFRGDSRLSTFVGGITVRVARRALRRSAWQRRRAPLDGEPTSSQPAPDDHATARQQLRRLHRAFDRLKPNKRIALTLWALEGLSPTEIAQITGASVAATRSRIFYAQKELQAMASRDPWLRPLLGEHDAR